MNYEHIITAVDRTTMNLRIYRLRIVEKLSRSLLLLLLLMNNTDTMI